MRHSSEATSRRGSPTDRLIELAVVSSTVIGRLRKVRGITADQCGARLTHAKVHGDRAYLGRKRSYTRAQLAKVRDLLRQEAVGIARIAQTDPEAADDLQHQDDPAGSEAAMAAWGL